MTAAKSEVLKKRLLSAGLPAEICSRYIEILRAFLNARLTKCRYEDEMLKILPKDKIHVHNVIIQDILSRALQKRPGLRDLPVVQPLKRPPARRPPPTKVSNGPIPPDKKKAIKRPLEEVETDNRKPGHPDDAGLPSHPKKPKLNPKVPKKVETEKQPATKPRLVDKPSPKVPKVVRKPLDAPGITRPASGSQQTRMPPPKIQAQPSGTEIPTYEGLPYFPVRPGEALDLDIFLKLRNRVRRKLSEHAGALSGVKDDALGLLTHGIEHHVKTLLEAAVKQRMARDGVRPHGNLQSGPVRANDFLAAARRNPTLFGDELNMDLERLSFFP